MAMKRLKVGAETARQLSTGHPWVIADRDTARWPKSLGMGQVVGLESPRGEFLATALAEPGARIVARCLDRQPANIDREWFRRRLRRAVELRRACIPSGRTEAMRLVNGEGDGLPGLTLDRYGDWLMLQFYTPAWQPHLDTLAAAIGQELRPRGLYLKFRPQQTRELAAKGGDGDLVRLVAGEPAPELLPVRENGLTFLVRLNEGLHTGLFLDQRDNRRRFQQASRDRAVLNLFCFTGAFSVAALAGGAASVTSVDASRSYLNWCRRHVEANGLPQQRSELVRGDCFQVLGRLAQQGRVFDLVFVDPPSFSTVGRGRFTTRRGTSELVAALLPVVRPGGIIFACSNHQKVDWAEYLKELRRGAAHSGRTLQVLGTWGQGPDFPFAVGFPEGRYLKCVQLRLEPED
ncbi:SAM-dependent methyltransferase [Geothermobacter ehrlichii]|uniref:SAM-dependent methyltransferase n=1 Tax=Geothermobacter ehrlichii TaxID=213224 RepID=A0A5D3WL21_9BACT|nr:class I SAM-dependent rRNA methyltransferase [Geothermobacter ehrlichii]TYO98663.1 SAM-dependent methyltransferase [Geothermobacter ehrlichii]